MSCLTEGLDSNALMAPWSTGCTDNHRQTPYSALGLQQGACFILRAGKSKVANPNPSSRVAHGPPFSLPTLCGIFPKIYAIQKAKLVQRLYSQKAEHPTFGEKSILLFLEKTPHPWLRLTWGSLNFLLRYQPCGGSIWDWPRHPTDALAFHAGMSYRA